MVVGLQPTPLETSVALGSAACAPYDLPIGEDAGGNLKGISSGGGLRAEAQVVVWRAKAQVAVHPRIGNTEWMTQMYLTRCLPCIASKCTVGWLMVDG